MSKPPIEPSPDQELGRAFAILAVAVALVLFAAPKIQNEVDALAGAISYLHVYPYAWLAERMPALREIPYIGPRLFERAGIALRFLEQGSHIGMSAGQRREVLSAAGTCALPVYLPLLIVAGARGRRRRPDLACRNAYGLDGMIRTQSERWPTSRGARHVNPLAMPEVSAGHLARRVVETAETRDRGRDGAGNLVRSSTATVSPASWHRALRPEEWLVANGLCLDQAQVEAAARAGWNYPDRQLESREAWSDLTLESLMETFAGQLRSPWRGFENLRPCGKALCATFCLFLDYDVTGGNVLLDDLGRVHDAIRGRPGGMDDAILARKRVIARIEGILGGPPGKRMLEIANRHAWQETAFPAMLSVARKDRGVLPSAAFLWLKAEDRLLWYILNNVGSEATMVEAAGAMAHYRAELQVGKPIRRPAVRQAARALLVDYLDMTPNRVAARNRREELGRSAGKEIDIAFGNDGYS